MTNNLLQTKLFIPKPRPSFIPRPHLIEKLNQGLHGKLTIVCAPAGFGKTTLVSTWIQAERLSLALSTVKGHNRVIYGKLNVSRRTEAVARARELGIL